MIPGTDEYVSCDTLILSVGLIPENELSRLAEIELDGKTKGAIVDDNFQTNCVGIFAAGNVLHVHDLVDFVSIEAEELANAVTEFLKEGKLPKAKIEVSYNETIGHVIPQQISGEKNFKMSLRVRRPFGKCEIVVRQGEKIIAKKKMPKAIPAEMIQIQIQQERISSSQEIEVSVE